MFLDESDQRILYQSVGHDVAKLLGAAVGAGMAVDMAVMRFPEIHAALYAQAIRSITVMEPIRTQAPGAYPQQGVEQMPQMPPQTPGAMPQMAAQAPPPQIPQPQAQPVGYPAQAPAQAQQWGQQGSPQGQMVPQVQNGQPPSQPQMTAYPPQQQQPMYPQVSAPMGYGPAPASMQVPVPVLSGATSPAPYQPQGAAPQGAVAHMPMQAAPGPESTVAVQFCPRGRTGCLITQDQYDLSMIRRGVAMCAECYRDPALQPQQGGPNPQ